MKPGDVVLLENSRFYPEEKKNDSEFAKKLAEDTGAEAMSTTLSAQPTGRMRHRGSRRVPSG